MRAVADSAASLAAQLGDANNVLVQAPAMGDEDAEACGSLLSVVPPDRSDVLCVTFNQPPDARLEHWGTYGGPTDAANLGFVVVGEGVRSAAADTAFTPRPTPDALGPTVVSVSNPGDLTGIGIELGRFLSDWAADDNQLLLCFHTLTTLLQYAELQTAYQFVHVLTGRVRSSGGLSHFHLDPTAHDQRTRNALAGLFDAVVERESDGTWSVSRRR